MARITTLLSLFLFALALKSAIADDPTDTDGTPIEIGVEYYILPAFSELGGGGVTLATNALAVIQSASESSLGSRVTMTANGTKVVEGDSTVTIKFTNISGHANSSTWMVVLDESAKMWYVGIGNAEDYPSDRIKKGNFQITTFMRGYKFVFCSATDCQDVGTYVDSDGNKRLALVYGGAHVVKFKNADR